MILWTPIARRAERGRQLLNEIGGIHLVNAAFGLSERRVSRSGPVSGANNRERPDVVSHLAGGT
jgi:hypothetical protein